MVNQRNLIERFTNEVWNNQNFNVFQEVLSQDFEYHDPLAPDTHDRNDYMGFIKEIQVECPDMSYEIIDVISETNKVAVLYSWSGTPTVEIGGVEPSGKKVEHKGTAIYYLDEDKVYKLWDIWDKYSVIMQLKTN